MAAIWYCWNAATTTTASTTSTWMNWCEADSTSTATTNVWVKWNATGGTSTAANYWHPTPAPKLSEEELAKRRAEEAARMEQYRRQEEDRRAAQEAANKKAEELLKRHLTGRQRRQYRRDRSFIVTGRDGENYKIRRGWSGHVTRLDSRGRAVEQFCIHPNIHVPEPDNQLIAKLMLETDPEQFKRIANRTPLVAAN